MASAWSNLSNVEQQTIVWKDKLTVELLLKVGALLIAMGVLIGKLNAIDSRVGRIEGFLDSHVVITGK